MISKKELLEKIKEATSTVTCNTLIGQNTVLNKYIDSEGIDELTKWAESLPDDQPDVLPFQWPIPDGMEIVTRDGRKVEQLHAFECKNANIAGIVNGEQFIRVWDNDGTYSTNKEPHIADLFLRRKEKKVWVVEWPNNIRYIYSDFPVAVTDPDCNIYEATLKPVV